MNNARDQRSKGPRDDRRNWAVGQPRNQNGDSGVMDVMKMIEAFTTCLENFNTGLKVTIHVPNPIRISP